MLVEAGSISKKSSRPKKTPEEFNSLIVELHRFGLRKPNPADIRLRASVLPRISQRHGGVGTAK